MYLKKEDNQLQVYAGPSLGVTAMSRLGFLRYDGALPVSRLAVRDDGTIEELPEPERVAVYSKLKLRDQLVLAGMWNAVRSAMNEDQYECWLIANEIRSDDPRFLAVFQAVSSQLANADEILLRARIV